MLRLLADENFNREIVRGLSARHALLDVVRVQDVSLRGASDLAILQWAADNDRIVLTHDRATMRDFAGDRLAAGQAMCGLFVLNYDFPIGLAIDELVLLGEASEHYEWNGRIVYLPL